MTQQCAEFEQEIDGQAGALTAVCEKEQGKD